MKHHAFSPAAQSILDEAYAVIGQSSGIIGNTKELDHAIHSAAGRVSLASNNPSSSQAGMAALIEIAAAYAIRSNTKTSLPD
ncbi:MAG: hypothetical protein AAFR90_01960 [Pseudomonadota bacterium]